MHCFQNVLAPIFLLVNFLKFSTYKIILFVERNSFVSYHKHQNRVGLPPWPGPGRTLRTSSVPAAQHPAAAAKATGTHVVTQRQCLSCRTSSVVIQADVQPARLDFLAPHILCLFLSNLDDFFSFLPHSSSQSFNSRTLGLRLHEVCGLVLF